MCKVYLKVPTLEEMKYRQKWMKDANTMNYNSGYDINVSGYNYNDGTIIKSNEEIENWYNLWINKEPHKYFAYIYSADNDIPVGEIYFYYDNDLKIHSMGILITYKNRGKGYSIDALKELFKVAFEKISIDALSDFIPIYRTRAIKIFKEAGFIETELVKDDIRFGKKEVSRQLLLTKEEYFKNKGSK